MYKTITRWSLLLLLLSFVSTVSLAQGTEEDRSYKPLTLKLDESGNKYVRFIMWHQLWATTGNLSNDASLTNLDFSIRRSRFLAYSQISSRFLILTHWGLNSLSAANQTSLGNNGDTPQLFLHDAWAEVRMTEGHYVGAGLHYWNGLTRLASASTLNFMSLDQSRPFTAWHALGVSDQFARHLGVYFKGKFDRLEYRVSWNNPMQSPLGDGRDYSSNFNTNGAQSTLTYTGVRTPDADGNVTGNNVFMGYFKYDLWDQESNKLPYYVGTYLGKKKVLAIGTGFFLHPNGMYDNISQSHESISHFAGDVFMEYPTTGGALHAYASYTQFNYGDNYISRWGGTGSVFFGQLGYYVNSAKIMPYVTLSNASYEGAPDALGSMDIGVNYYINGHHAKLTAEYHTIRNDFREAGLTLGGQENLSQFRVQLHVFL